MEEGSRAYGNCGGESQNDDSLELHDYGCVVGFKSALAVELTE